MDKETRKLLAKLYTSQLEKLANEKGIDCGEDPDRIDYLSTLGKSDLITKDDVEHYIGKMDEEKGEEVEGEEYFGEIEKILKEFRTQGPIFDEANELLKGMQNNFSEGNLEGTISKGVEGSGIIEDMSKRFERVRKAFVIYAFRQLISDVKGSGIDTEETEALVLKAAEFFHRKEYEELESILSDMANKAENLIKEQSKRMKDLILEVEEFLDQARDLGADTKEARDLFRKAEEAFDSKSYKKVDNFAIKAKKAAEEARKDRIQGLSDSLLFVKTILDDTKEIGADISEADSLYKKAKSAFDEEDYNECKTLIKEAEQMALQLQDAQIQKALSLRRRREAEEKQISDIGREVVEVQPEILPPPQRKFIPPYPQTDSRPYSQPPETKPRMPTKPTVRKTRCPNCGQSFPVRGGKGPIKIECPFCGMRGLMP